MNQTNYKIDALWDAEAETWVATSDEVPGLATEASTLEALAQKLRSMVPELLQLNDAIEGKQTSSVTIDIVSRRQEIVQLAA